MSKFVEGNARMTQARNTQCPGTLAYMSPEALRQITPCYSEKLDIFSLGVLMIQIVTRKFPAPTDRLHTENKDPTAPTGYVLVPIPELQRWKDDVAKVPHDHTFGPIFRQCIKDKEVDRPTAAHLCGQMKQLKESMAYKTGEEEAKRRKISVEPPNSQGKKEKEDLVRKVIMHKENAATLRRKLKQKEQEEWRIQEENRRLAAEKREQQLKLATERALKAEAEAKQEKEMKELKSLLDRMETTAAEVCCNNIIQGWVRT